MHHAYLRTTIIQAKLNYGSFFWLLGCGILHECCHDNIHGLLPTPTKLSLTRAHQQEKKKRKKNRNTI